jgi:hypothetical protein
MPPRPRSDRRNRRVPAKVAGVSADGTGSHRLTVGSDAGLFTDLDGFVWKARAACPHRRFPRAGSPSVWRMLTLRRVARRL